jgi:hypothetical protein
MKSRSSFLIKFRFPAQPCACLPVTLSYSQLYTGAIPYANMRYAEIVFKVAVQNMRPTFPDDTPSVYRTLAEQCWATDANSRPPFDEIISRLDEMLARVTDLESERIGVAGSGSVDSPAGGGVAAVTPRDPNDVTLQSPWIGESPCESVTSVTWHATIT